MAEEIFAQLFIRAQSWQQVFVAFGDVEINCGGNFAQVANSFGDERRAGLAIIYIEAAAVVESDAGIVISAESVIPGEPVEEDGRLVLQEAENLRDHLLVAAEHAVGVDDAFGHAGGTGGEEDFRDGVWLDFFVCGLDGLRWLRGCEFGEASCFSGWRWRGGYCDFCVVRYYLLERTGVAFAI